ncbi:unnamed protein product [Moneuplotes crassus]|uniref:CTLH domain-containing protein n=1 Tax=Euplotes crassus TaxID=5936 RepID=A0AAD1Y989_EUPCR|nr:unnamed protein product [Moneuplotes crassus]
MEGLSHKSIIYLILDYLQRNKLFRSLLSLETETQIELYKYSKEIKFFRNLIIEGQWEDAENFLQPLKLKKNFNHNAVVFELRRQKFLEMVDQNESYKTYVKALKDLEELCPKEEFNSLCYCLTISSLNEHPDYQKWSSQNGRFQAFENCKKHLCSVFTLQEDAKVNLESSLEELLQYSYNTLHRKASEMIQKELNKSISSSAQKKDQDYSQYESYKSRGKSFKSKYQKYPEDKSSSMMLIGLQEKEQMLMMSDPEVANENRNSFDDNNLDRDTSCLRTNQDDSQDQVSVHRDTSMINQIPSSHLDEVHSKLFRESMRKGSPIGVRTLERNQDTNMSKILSQSYPNNILDHEDQDLIQEEEEEETEGEISFSQEGINPSQLQASERSLNTQQKDDFIPQEDRMYNFQNNLYSESNLESENDLNPLGLVERGILTDSLPIRTGCFNGDYLAIGTNSQSLKICNIAKFMGDFGERPLSDQPDFLPKVETDESLEEIPVIFNQLNHHEGSIYCLDWTRCERLIASGSNDRKIKILVCPPLNELEEGEESDNLLELTLIGHQAIVRTLCFDPDNELSLVSGGEGDSSLKIWNTETGENILDLEGHSDGIFSIRPNFDGSFFASVGKDMLLKVWDLRQNKCAFSIDCSEFGETTCVSLNSEVHNIHSKIAAVSHTFGGISIWDLNMRKCVNDIKAHEKETRSVSFSYDGKYLASGGFDSTIQICDLLKECEIVQTLHHSNKVISVKWHSQQSILLSTSADKTAKIWSPSY